MAEMHDITGVCPVCGEAMVVTRLSCPHCASALEGVFHVTGGLLDEEARYGRLARLDQGQLEFIETFLRCRGVIKNVEDMLGISYPTVKARLATVLEAMGFGSEEELPAAERRRMRRVILADLASGRITIEEAHRLLRNLVPGEGDDDEREETDD